MPIKREQLERKWYYRAAKVALIALPFVIVILWLLSLLRGTTVACSVVPKYDPGLIKKMAVYFVVGLAAYALLLLVATRAFFYLVFGGIEEEKRKDDAAPPAPRKMKVSEIIPLIILLIVFAIIALAESGKIKLPKLDVDGGGLNGGGAGGECRQTSAEWGIPCRSVQDGVGVTGLPVPARCECPLDTTYSGTTDVVTPGGPYKICVCK